MQILIKKIKTAKDNPVCILVLISKNWFYIQEINLSFYIITNCNNIGTFMILFLFDPAQSVFFHQVLHKPSQDLTSIQDHIQNLMP